MAGIEKALEIKRKLIEGTYTGACTIIERADATDDDTKITSRSEVTIVEDQPCRISFESIGTVVSSDTAPTQSQGVKLFIAPEIAVTPGSKITVTQNDVTTVYCASGVPAVYTTHQEIMLELFEGWA